MFPCFLLLCIFLLDVGVSTSLQRSSERSSSMKFYINSRRNQTGHWIAQVELKHGAESTDSGPWEVDVDQTTTHYGDEESVVIAATITAPPRGSASKLSKPPADYKHLPGQGYYKFHRDPKTWMMARLTCEEEGTHLAVINNAREALAVASLFVRDTKRFNDWRDDWAFIGIHDLFEDGQYVTVLNETLQDAGYNIWYSGEPDGGTAQNCGNLNANSQLGTCFCTVELQFICEYKE